MSRVTTRLAGLVLAATVSASALGDYSEAVRILQQPGIGFTGQGASPRMIGYEFIPIRNITVDALGYFDEMVLGIEGSGFREDHPVALWETASQTLLASTTVTNADPLAADSFFRYHDVPDVALTAGTSYVVAGWHNALDWWLFDVPANMRTIHPDIQWVADRHERFVPAGTFPTGSLGTLGNYGGNVMLVPEPGSVVVMALGAVALLRRRPR